MYDHAIATNLICIEVDGVVVIQGHINDICVHLQTQVASNMIHIHCMAHIMNLACKIISKFDCVTKLEDLVDEIHSYFFHNPKGFEFK